MSDKKMTEAQMYKEAAVTKMIGVTLAATAIGGPVAGAVVGAIGYAGYKIADNASKKIERELSQRDNGPKP